MTLFVRRCHRWNTSCPCVSDQRNESRAGHGPSQDIAIPCCPPHAEGSAPVRRRCGGRWFVCALPAAPAQGGGLLRLASTDDESLRVLACADACSTFTQQQHGLPVADHGRCRWRQGQCTSASRLEAMLLATPVPASKTSSLPEVARHAARLVNPYDTREIAEGVRALNSDQQLHADLSARGRVQAAKRTEQADGERLAGVCQEVLARRK
jgi:hypothetical protein